MEKNFLRFSEEALKIPSRRSRARTEPSRGGILRRTRKASPSRRSNRCSGA
jgi:hypothetical protein